MEIYKYKSYDLYCECNECVCLNNYCKSHKFNHSLNSNNVSQIITLLELEQIIDPLNTYFLTMNNKIMYKSHISNFIIYILFYTSNSILSSEIISQILEFI